MAVSVRLDEKTELLLKETAATLRTTKSRVLKSSLEEYCRRVREEHGRSPYSLLQDLVGKEGSGRGDLSVRGEEVLRCRFRRKRP